MVEGVAGEPAGCGAADDGGEEAPFDSGLFGEVFDEACGKGGKTGYEHELEEAYFGC